MSDQNPSRPRHARAQSPQLDRDPDYAARMARAEFGRFYLDTARVEQTLKEGEIVFRHKASDPRRKARPG